MDQIVQKTPVGHRSSAFRRMGWFVALVLLLVLGGAGGIAWFNIQLEENAVQDDVSQRLAGTARSKAANLSFWYGSSVQGQAERLLSADLFRLFASEVNDLGDDIALLLSSAPAKDDSLAAKLPLMQNLLREFVNFSGFLSARIMNVRGQTYLATEGTPSALSLTQKAAVGNVLESGVPLVLPLRKGEEGLIMDAVFPIFAPQYISGTEGRVIATLLLSRVVSSKLGEVVAAAGGEQSLGSTQIVQFGDGRMELLNPLNAEIRPLNWKPEERDTLPFMVRNGIDGSTEEVYSIGVRVPELPLFVVQGVSVEEARQPFIEARNSILRWAGFSVVLVVLCVLAFWWWLVGRSARSANEEILGLYQTLNQQKQLLDGINRTLVDGIVLMDRGNQVRYANEAFSRIVGRPVEELPGMDGAALFGYDSALRLYKHTDAAIENDKPVFFRDILWLRSKKYHFQITSSPFRDENEKVVGVVSVFRDMTRLVEAEERNQRMVQQTIAALVQAIEALDPYLGGHSTHMGRLAADLVRTLRMSDADETTVRTAASLSQIGKMRLPRALLNKPGAFTPEERQAMERHVEYAREALHGIDFELPVLETICQMNELMDGSGYPEHLKGDQIDIHARILAVANTFCALVRPRAYRNAKTVEEALGILEEAHAKYDQEVVQALRAFLKTPAGERFVAGLAEQQ